MLIFIAGWTTHEDNKPTNIYIGTDGEAAIEAAKKAQASSKFEKGCIKRFNLNRSSGIPLPVVPDVQIKAESAGNEESAPKGNKK